MQDVLEEVLGAGPQTAPGDSSFQPVPPAAFDGADIDVAPQLADWHTTAEHTQVVDEYTHVAYYLHIDTDWLADVACRHAIEIGDQYDYPVWYGCMQVRFLRDGTA